MPTIIRQALSDRIRRLPELREFLRDFHAATGLPVEFVGPLGHRAPERTAPPMCAFLQGTAGGCRMCASSVQLLLEQASEAPVQFQCDAGLWESAVPLRAGGQTFGYFLLGGYFTKAPGIVEKNGIRHRFERLGARIDAPALDELCTRSPLVDAERHASLARMLALAAAHLVRAITDNLVEPTGELPPLVRAACDHARRSFLHETSLQDIARRLNVTTAHLCRVFHRATGLRFREYVGRLRAEYARNLLEGTDRPITDIAFAAGFQSLSQFNRVFRAIHGVAPRDLRKARHVGVRKP